MTAASESWGRDIPVEEIPQFRTLTGELVRLGQALQVATRSGNVAEMQRCFAACQAKNAEIHEFCRKK